MEFRLFWNRHVDLEPSEQLFIRNSADGTRINVGDIIYVVSGSADCRLLARLVVRSAEHDRYRARVVLTVGGSHSVYFFSRSRDAAGVRLMDEDRVRTHMEAAVLDACSAQALATACGTHDFGLPAVPPRWNAIMRSAKGAISQSRRSGDTRPEVEIVEEFLRGSYVTSQLPGPTPVYQNAARRILGLDSPLESPTHRERHVLTDDIIAKGINDDVAASHHMPDSQRHQGILERLKNQLEYLGFVPKYDGLVDCIIETDDTDIYFEVKSADRESVVRQTRAGLGQVLYYIWIDSELIDKEVRGYLVVEGPWDPRDEELTEFVGQYVEGLTWSNEIESLDTSDLGLTD